MWGLGRVNVRGRWDPATGETMNAKPVVVIIDDSPSNITLLRAYLGPDYAVRFATSGEVGIAVVRKEKPDLVLLDVVMPGIDGYEVCARLKDDPETRDIPVVFVTAQTEVDNEAQGLSLGAVDYITKPITPAIVRARVRVHVELKRFREQNIQDLADRLSLATKAGEVGVWDYDIATGRLIWNDEMWRLYGLVPQGTEKGYADWLACIHPDDRARVEGEYRRLVVGTSPLAAEFRIRRPGGAIRATKAMGIVFKDDAGNPVRLLGTNWDITEHHCLVEDLKTARAAAEAAHRAKDRFIAVATHELLTPLNAISGFGQSLLESETSPERKKQLQFVCEAGRSLESLVNDILDYVRIDADEIKAEITSFTLARELGGILADFQASAQKKGLALAATVSPSLAGELVGPLTMLRLVLTRLIDNGLKFTTVGGVTVAAEPSEPRAPGGRTTVLVSVRDTGQGIRKENLEKIFDLFEQEDDATARRFEGIGLGLTLVRRVVALMGGRLWVESEPGQGACFFFTAEFDVKASFSSC